MLKGFGSTSKDSYPDIVAAAVCDLQAGRQLLRRVGRARVKSVEKVERKTPSLPRKAGP